MDKRSDDASGKRAGMTVDLDASTTRVLRALARRRGRTVEEELRSLVRHGAEGEAARITSGDLLAGFERFREVERAVSLAELRRAGSETDGASSRR